ncbi:hypothetical protein GC163_22300 [bacterium]|nr:hypothetical protein [bacterium]
MPYDCLGNFLTALEDTAELMRVGAAVDLKLEVAAITDRVVQRSGDGGPALWFSAARNSAWPVVTNLLGHRQRICRALGVTAFEHLTTQWGEDIRRFVTHTNNTPRTPTKLIRQAVCQQVIKLGRDVNLWDLPALTSWPQEVQRCLTGGLIVTPAATDSRPLLSRGTLAVVDRQTLLPHWTPDAREWQALRAAQRANRQLPVAIVFGGDPRLILAAESGSWLMGNVGYDFVSVLRQTPLETVKCRTHDLEVPAEAEVIIEGLINPDAVLTPCDAVALPTGTLSRETPSVPLVVTAITHRANPVFPARVVQGSPGEDAQIREAVDQLFLRTMQACSPGIVDVFRPAAGHGQMVIASIDKQYPYQSRTIAGALRGLPGLSRTAMLILVDADINLRREANVWRAIALHTDSLRDVTCQPGPAEWEHPANALPGCGGQLTIDATRKLPGEQGPDIWPNPLAIAVETQQLLTTRWAEYGLPIHWGTES